MQLTQQELQREGQQSSTEPSVANTHRNSRAGDNIIYGIFSSKKDWEKPTATAALRALSSGISCQLLGVPGQLHHVQLQQWVCPSWGGPDLLNLPLIPAVSVLEGGVNSTPRYALRVINSPSALFKAERVAMSQGNLPNEHQLLLTVLPEPYSGLPALPCPVPKALLFQSARDGGAQRWVGAANFYHLLHCARFIFPILLIWPAVHDAIYLTSLIAAVKLLNQAEIPSLIRSTF